MQPCDTDRYCDSMTDASPGMIGILVRCAGSNGVSLLPKEASGVEPVEIFKLLHQLLWHVLFLHCNRRDKHHMDQTGIPQSSAPNVCICKHDADATLGICASSAAYSLPRTTSTNVVNHNSCHWQQSLLPCLLANVLSTDRVSLPDALSLSHQVHA